MKKDKRVIKSIRVSPSVTIMMNEISLLLMSNTSSWGTNPHTKELGYWAKSKISSADVLEIAVTKLYNEIFKEEK